MDLLRGLKGKAFVLTSGGKDSILAAHLAKEQQIELKGLLTLIPLDKESMLYHTYNLNWVSMIAQSMSLELMVEAAKKEEELEALRRLLKRIDIEILITGGISSHYQKTSFEKVCQSLGIHLYSPLWGKKAEEIYEMIMIRAMKVMVIAVAAYGLDDKWLGVILERENIERLLSLSKKYKFDPIGEGGDLDTIVLKAPLYRRELKVLKSKKYWYGDRGFLQIESMEFSNNQGEVMDN